MDCRAGRVRGPQEYLWCTSTKGVPLILPAWCACFPARGAVDVPSCLFLPSINLWAGTRARSSPRGARWFLRDISIIPLPMTSNLIMCRLPGHVRNHIVRCKAPGPSSGGGPGSLRRARAGLRENCDTSLARMATPRDRAVSAAPPLLAPFFQRPLPPPSRARHPNLQQCSRPLARLCSPPTMTPRPPARRNRSPPFVASANTSSRSPSEAAATAGRDTTRKRAPARNIAPIGPPCPSPKVPSST